MTTPPQDIQSRLATAKGEDWFAIARLEAAQHKPKTDHFITQKAEALIKGSPLLQSLLPEHRDTWIRAIQRINNLLGHVEKVIVPEANVQKTRVVYERAMQVYKDLSTIYHLEGAGGQQIVDEIAKNPGLYLYYKALHHYNIVQRSWNWDKRQIPYMVHLAVLVIPEARERRRPLDTTLEQVSRTLMARYNEHKRKGLPPEKLLEQWDEQLRKGGGELKEDVRKGLGLV